MDEKIEIQGTEKEKHEAQAMADLIEDWIASGSIRKFLRFCTKRDKCGRRIDNALRSFAGEDVQMCTTCKIATFFLKRFMGTVLNRTNSDENEIKKFLKDSMWRRGLSSVLEGVAEWGPRKPFTAYAPFLIVWNVTRMCNLNCKHCYAHAGHRDPNELNHEEALEAVDKMADAGVAYVALSGGEPLVRPDIWDIIKRIRERGMAFSIATNATILTKERAQKLKDYKCLYIQVSVDGSNAETHNWFRGRNAFELTMQGIKNAVDIGIHVGVSCTVTQHNYKEVPDVIDLAEKIGAKTFMHYNFVPAGRGEEIINLDLTPYQREELLQMLAKETKNRKISVLSTAAQYSRVCLEQDAAIMAMTHFDNSGISKGSPLSVLADFIGGCGTGRLYCALDYDGTISPCVFMPDVKLGNIRNDDLLHVWHNAPEFKEIREREHFWGYCGECEYRNTCGGCRARAFGYFKDLKGPDVGCIKNKEYWEKIKSEISVESKVDIPTKLLNK